MGSDYHLSPPKPAQFRSKWEKDDDDKWTVLVVEVLPGECTGEVREWREKYRRQLTEEQIEIVLEAMEACGFRPPARPYEF